MSPQRFPIPTDCARLIRDGAPGALGTLLARAEMAAITFRAMAEHCNFSDSMRAYLRKRADDLDAAVKAAEARS